MAKVASKPVSSPAPMSGADILVESLIRHGVEVVFAYPGGASMPIHQSLTRVTDKLRTILPRHEQGGGFMAHGYSRATGKPSVCFSTSGPGATNFVTCIADAKMDSIPCIFITGQVGTNVLGNDAFQETPMVEICRGITKHHYLVTKTEDVARVMKEAFHIATTGRPGPVLIDMPKDVQVRQVVPDFDCAMNLPGYKPLRKAPRAELEPVIAAIRASKKPIIYAGGGVTHAGAAEELTKFATATGIPVALTLHGLGNFPADHYLCLHMLGMHGTVYSNYAVNDSDLLLSFGVRFDDRVTGKLSEFAKHGKIVHVDIDKSEIHKNKFAHIPVHGDVKYAIGELNAMLAEDRNADLVGGGRYTEWMRQIDEWRTADPMVAPERKDDLILPQSCIKRMYEIIRDRGLLGDTIITTGVGQHQMWSAQFFPFVKPRHWITSGGLGTMGFGLPAAMGAKVAFPNKLVIDVDGDGSFLMNVQELATCFTEKIPAKVLLLNNQHLGMVMQWEDRFFGSNRGHTYLGANTETPFPDFVTIAKGFGIATAEVTNRSDLDAALIKMIESPGPYVLNVHVPHQEHVLPMIPSGMTVRDMIKA
ncbi:MAG: biosynthetic-type acetolactate synthase large subunit [Gemmataceae bacterium]